jgi:hypothetical protein
MKDQFLARISLIELHKEYWHLILQWQICTKLEIPSLQGIEKRFLLKIYYPTLKELKRGSLI